MTPWYRERAIIVASMSCGAAALLFAIALGHAVTTPHDELPPDSRAGRVSAVVSEGINQVPLPTGVLAEAVERDPFHPERRRPTVPFALPGAPTVTTPVLASPAPAPTLRLLGTVITAGQDAFVLVQAGAEPPRVVRVGGEVAGVTLRKIEPGRAVFRSSNGETVDLHVSKPDA